MSAVLDISISMRALTCCHGDCGMTFAVPLWWEQGRRQTKSLWYCPNGHSQSFTGDNEAERLKKELELAKNSRDYYRADVERINKRLIGQRAATTRVSNKLKTE